MYGWMDGCLQDVITLAVAPSVCVLRQCVCLPDELLLGRFDSFTETSSVLALGTSLSSATEGKKVSILTLY